MDEELQRVLQAAADEATGTKGDIPIPKHCQGAGFSVGGGSASSDLCG
jgi:hypothetical protein